jgi:hypothetical protein
VIVTSGSKADIRCAAGDDLGIAIGAPSCVFRPASSSLRNDCGAMLQFPAGRGLRRGAFTAVSVPGGGTLAVSVERLRMAYHWPDSCWHGARGHVGCPDAVARARGGIVRLLCRG